MITITCKNWRKKSENKTKKRSKEKTPKKSKKKENKKKKWKQSLTRMWSSCELQQQQLLREPGWPWGFGIWSWTVVTLWLPGSTEDGLRKRYWIHERAQAERQRQRTLPPRHRKWIPSVQQRVLRLKILLFLNRFFLDIKCRLCALGCLNGDWFT